MYLSSLRIIHHRYAAIRSVVLTVALYPYMIPSLAGVADAARLAAVLLTIINLLS